MKETGTVLDIKEDGTAVVAVCRTAACQSCRACIMSGDDNVMLAEAFNEARAGVGDQVAVEMGSQAVLMASAILYLVPLIAFGLGYFAGWLTLPLFISSISRGSAGIIMGFLFCAASFVGIAYVDRRAAKSYHFRPVVKRVVTKALEGR